MPRLSKLAWIVLLLLALGACSTAVTPTPDPSLTPTITAGAPTSQTPPPEQDVWAGLYLRTPFPYGTPLPPAEGTPLDGVYVKFEDKPGTPVPCRRCPDYAIEGGVWKLSFDRGIFRIHHPLTGWKSIGSYSLDGASLSLFNDPNCTDVTGAYTWVLQDGVLTVSAVEDTCAIRLRAMNLAHMPWQSCQPPNHEAAISGHWLEPEGCAP